MSSADFPLVFKSQNNQKPLIIVYERLSKKHQRDQDVIQILCDSKLETGLEPLIVKF